ncbi:hypothetical protein TIFTF001_041034 [Ficus carica]|uniref:Uncharacterized protein n=1 Tax=Ficus carica TaxID=3494 RepID=A0AA88CS63_FICCA|nr:hypothetical protein TIFTF001_041034 [Ficus carica]
MLLSPAQNPKVSLSYSTSYSGPIPWNAASLSLTQHSVTQNQIQRRLIGIKCSISQIHSYGTMDYERRPMLKWNAIYKRISLMEKPELGSGTVLTQ